MWILSFACIATFPLHLNVYLSTSMSHTRCCMWTNMFSGFPLEFSCEKIMPNLCYFMTNVTFICINTLYMYALYIILQIFYIEALPCQHFLYLLCLAKQFPYLSCHRKKNKIINIHWPMQAANLQPSNNQVNWKWNFTWQ